MPAPTRHRPPEQTPGRAVTPAQVARFRLLRHHLDRPADPSALVEVVGDMGGAQAQLPSAAELSVAVRLRALRAGAIEDAVRRRRTLTRAWAMRRTVFLLPSNELAVFVRGSAGRADREVTYLRNRGLPESRIRQVLDALARCLDRPRTRPELAEALGAELDLRPVPRAGGTGWGSRREVAWLALAPGLEAPVDYLLHVAGSSEVICAGPPQDGQATFVRADRWVPDYEDLPRVEAERRLLRRYLRSYGPATVQDFVAWSRVRYRDAARTWAGIAGELAAVRVDGAPAFVPAEDLDTLLAPAGPTPPVRLLPHFDAFLLGHEDRAHLVAPARRTSVYRPQGWIAPVVLVRGRVAGTWEQGSGPGPLRIGVRPFGPLSATDVRGVRSAANAIGRFLGRPLGGVELAPVSGGRGLTGTG